MDHPTLLGEDAARNGTVAGDISKGDGAFREGVEAHSDTCAAASALSSDHEDA